MTKHTFLLVHGTWARGMLFPTEKAAWCEPGSPLRKMVDDMMEDLPAPYNVETFEWSGSNSFRSRLKWANKLAGRLDLIRQANEETFIHIVAHSHGGNLVMNCLADPAQQRQVGSATFLSTPFLHVYPRRRDPDVRRKIVEIFEMLGVGSVIALFLWMFTVLTHDPDNFVKSLSFSNFALFIPFFFVGLGLGSLLVKRVYRLAIRRHLTMAKRLRLPSRLPFPSLLIRCTSDEAGNVLVASQLLSTLMSSTVVFFARYANLKYSAFWGAALGGAMWIAKYFHIIEKVDGTWYGNWVIGVPFALLVIMCLGPYLLVALTIALGIIAKAFGSSIFFGGFSMEISAEATPPGHWELLQLPGIATKRFHGKQHSTHSLPAAIDELRRFLEKAVRYKL